MSSPVQKWFQRATRYVLRPEDNQFFRFANEQRHITTGIEILNISKTGLAFTVHRENSPQLGENIMIEFEVPGTGPMACYARVVRLEEQTQKASWNLTKKSIIVGVKFLNLHRGQLSHLHQGLEKKFKQLRVRQWRENFRRRLLWLQQHSRLILIYFVVIFAMVFVFYFLTQPRGNYTNDKAIPWGTRKF